MKLIALTIMVLAVAGSVATFGREYRISYFSRSPKVAVFEVLSTQSGVPAVPLSSRSMRELFETCADVHQGAIYGFQPAEIQQTVDDTCATLARDALLRSPTYAGAHTILMLSSRDPAQIVEELILSQATAPFESWHAKLRLRTGLPFYGTGQQSLDTAIMSDIAFMVQTAGGRAWLARLYQRETQLRDTIVSGVERRPNAEKAAFLQEVRRLGQD